MFGIGKDKFKLQPVITGASYDPKNGMPDYYNVLEYSWIKENYKDVTCLVAILDNGVFPHYELINNLKSSKDFTNEKPQMKGGSHGTHVAGTVSSESFSMISMCPLANLKVLNSQTGSGQSRDIAKGIDEAIRLGVKVINLSLGSDNSSLKVTNSLANFCKDPSNFAIIATGNDGNETNFPSWLAEKYPNIIAVGSGNIDSMGNATLSNFSSRGVVTLIAQGENVVSTVRNNRFQPMTGTSMATPSVSALVAICKSLIPDFNCYDFHEICQMEGSCIDLDKVGKDSNTGYGFLMPASFLRNLDKFTGLERPQVKSIDCNVSILKKILAFVNIFD